jgi:hypothetical protein
MTPIQPFNTVQLVLRDRIIPKFLPPITQALPPTTWFQRLVWRLADRAGLLVHNYVPKIKEVQTKTVVLEGTAQAIIANAIIAFMNDDGQLNPQRDLIILWGEESFAKFARDGVDLKSDLVFARGGDGHREYRGIVVRVVSYISGPLVIRRRDL